jgi:hypothetical protein
MVFNTTFNNISVISWRPVLLVEETGSTRKKPLTCHKSLTNLLPGQFPYQFLLKQLKILNLCVATFTSFKLCTLNSFCSIRYKYHVIYLEILGNW